MDEMKEKIEQRTVPTKLMSTVIACNQTGIDHDRLRELTEAGYVPCWWIDGRPFYQKTKLIKWIHDNLAEEQEGKDFDRLHFVQCPKYDWPVNGEPPESLVLVPNLNQIPFPIAKYPPAIYFLCSGPEVVYVGQSTVLPARIGQHLQQNTKIFDRIFYIPVPEKRLNDVERMYIETLKPKYNGKNPDKYDNSVPAAMP